MTRSLGIIDHISLSGSMTSMEDAASFLDMSSTRSLLSSGDSCSSESTSQRDTIIVVMGPAVSGKSSFIKCATGKKITIGHGLKPCTKRVQSFSCPHPRDSTRNIIFIDTPGDDWGTYSKDGILESIAAWMDKTYGKNSKVALTGLLLFYPITDNRITDTLLRKSSMLQRLCGAEAFTRVTGITTMWSEIDAKLGLACEIELQKKWKSKIREGLRLSRFECTHESAWTIVDRCITGGPLPAQVKAPIHRKGCLPGYEYKLQYESSNNPKDAMPTQRFSRSCEESMSCGDIIIAVMGPTGAGKSSFIKCATGLGAIPIGHSLEPCTKEVQSFRCPHPRDNTRNIVFVDTPAYDPEACSKEDTLNNIIAWLDQTYGGNVTLAGLLFLHPIAANRVVDTLLKKSSTLQRLWGTEAFTRVTVVTTMWSEIDVETGVGCEVELQEKWNPMIKAGLQMSRFEYTHESAWTIVDNCITGGSLPVRVKTVIHPERGLGIQSLWNRSLSSFELFKRQDEPSCIFQESIITQLPQPCRVESVEAEDLSDGQVVIAVMGPTGSGKSSFIGRLTEDNTGAGYGLQSFTTDVKAVKFSRPAGNDVVIVDTPSFNDTCRSDIETLEMVSNWLVKTYKHKVTLAGILYFHRISDNRVGGTSKKNIRMFRDLCGESALENVTLVTTMWDEIDEETGQTREKELQRDFWKDMINHGSATARYTGTADSAWEIIDRFVGTANRRHALQLQKEMVDMEKKLNETKAGEELYTRLEVLVHRHQETLQKIRAGKKEGADEKTLQPLKAEHEGLREHITHIVEEMQTMRLPLSQRLLHMIGSPLGLGRRK